MTIQEALQRKPQEVSLPSIIPSAMDIYGENSREHERVLLEKGIKMLDASGVNSSFEELVSIIQPDFPDVSVAGIFNGSRDPKQPVKRFSLSPSQGIITTEIVWNTEDIFYDDLGERRYGGKNGNILRAQMMIHTGELVIHSYEKEEFITRAIPREIWETEEGKVIVENAVTNAYRNPLREPDTMDLG